MLGIVQADRQAGDALLVLRNQVNLVLEQARNQKLLGSALEAKVLLHVADAAAADSLRTLNSAANGADPLRYAFITSQAQLVDSQVNLLPSVSRKSLCLSAIDSSSEVWKSSVWKSLSNKTK
jgi:isoleucyl-tRNA synthetase